MKNLPRPTFKVVREADRTNTAIIVSYTRKGKNVERKEGYRTYQAAEQAANSELRFLNTLYNNL